MWMWKKKYWNLNLKRCFSKKTYGKECNEDECQTELNLICESGTCSCQQQKK